MRVVPLKGFVNNTHTHSLFLLFLAFSFFFFLFLTLFDVRWVKVESFVAIDTGDNGSPCTHTSIFSLVRVIKKTSEKKRSKKKNQKKKAKERERGGERRTFGNSSANAHLPQPI